MNNLLKFIERFQFLIIFLILEGFSIWLLADHSYYQKAQFGKLTRGITATLNNQINNIGQYLRLRQTNIELSSENIELRNELTRLKWRIERSNLPKTDSVDQVRYTYLKARVVNNSVNKQHNFLTLDVGSQQGIRPEMGIICGDGVVGVVASVSENFATAISLLNTNFKLSAKHKRTGFFGSLYWDGLNYREVVLSEIPQHAPIAVGDTIVTSGYSAIFPPGITIGTISGYDLKGGNFYTVRVQLAADFKRLDYVGVILSKYNPERVKLEKEAGYE
jgi:rod shape-determining protein MreC